MLSSIKIVSLHTGESLLFNGLKNVEKNLAITNITGIYPPKAEVNISPYAVTTGGYLTSRRLTSRNILFTFTTLSDDAELARQELYRIFSSNGECLMYFYSDQQRLEKTITGYTELIESSIFSSRVNVSVSVMCPDPLFYGTTPSEGRSDQAATPLFEFPFSNESLTENLIVFGEQLETRDLTVVYDSFYETGITAKLYISGNVTGLKLVSSTTKERIVLDDSEIIRITNHPLTAGDVITICTVPGKKRITLERGFSSYNLFSSMTYDSSWIRIVPGANKFAVSTERGGSSVTLHVSAMPVFLGV